MTTRFHFAMRLLLLAGLVMTGSPARAEEPALHVAAASSLADALKEIDADFTRTAGIKVELNLGASSALARQIQEGAPADVFFSADTAKMDVLAARGLLLPDTREDQLSNTLVVVVPADSSLKITAATDLAKPAITKIATGDPKAVPVGVYAKEYLEKLGLWSKIGPKVIATENVRAALAAVESGNVDAGIVYKTDAGVSTKVKIVFEIPAAEGPKIIYPMAALKAAAKPELAKRYLDFLDTPASKKTFGKFGFIVLPETDAGH